MATNKKSVSKKKATSKDKADAADALDAKLAEATAKAAERASKVGAALSAADDPGVENLIAENNVVQEKAAQDIVAKNKATEIDLDMPTTIKHTPKNPAAPTTSANATQVEHTSDLSEAQTVKRAPSARSTAPIKTPESMKRTGRSLTSDTAASLTTPPSLQTNAKLQEPELTDEVNTVEALQQRLEASGRDVTTSKSGKTSADLDARNQARQNASVPNDNDVRNTVPENVSQEPAAIVDAKDAKVDAKEKKKIRKSDGGSWWRIGGPHSGLLIGSLVWILLLSLIWLVYFYPDDADILIDVPARMDQEITVTPVFRGQTLASGKVHLTFEDVKNHQYLDSVTLDLDQTGSAKFDRNQLALYRNASMPLPRLRIVATAHGIYKSAADHRTQVVSGTKDVYLNAPQPLPPQFLWGIVVAGLAFVFFQIMAFTGNMTVGKLRALFVSMYVVPFVAMLIPFFIAVCVVYSPYLEEQMRDAPIGFVRAKLENSEKAQWLLNIGGTVSGGTSRLEDMVASTPINGAGTIASAANTAAATAVEPDPRDGANAAMAGLEVEANQTAASHAEGASLEDAASVAAIESGAALMPVVVANTEESIARVEGGVAVPMIVFAAALLGAGINMLRKLPKIQKKYHADSVIPNTTFAWDVATKMVNPFSRGTEIPGESRVKAAIVRSELIQNYIYFLAAPIFAVIVYYLLAFLVIDEFKAVLSIAALMTGFLADRIMVRASLAATRPFARRVVPANTSKS